MLNPILTTTNATLSARFAGLTGNFAQQLLAIAKVIEARSSLGASRQVFLATLGSFDTHTNQLRPAANPIRRARRRTHSLSRRDGDIGADSSVTSFTLSDFSRNFLPNTGGGTDHAWGSHPLVIGGAVKGGADLRHDAHLRCLVRTMRAIWVDGFRPSRSTNSPRRSRPGSAPTRRHSRRCCPISRPSARPISDSSECRLFGDGSVPESGPLLPVTKVRFGEAWPQRKIQPPRLAASP